eukprot:TRINITY_DN31187_c0_g1_i1.p2 TRINITY_DN31187_c0_g1~~TRINITY_DN31187_c0_g1_i1.p2  ORF type:complete len:307 (+),score=98.82 TRINITY_DN31187_c0_g1_i1:99-923(+)
MASQFEYFRLDRNGPVAEIVLNRPAKMNVLDNQFFDELGRAVDTVQADPEVRVALLWAEGKVFTAGLDLKSAGSVFVSSGDESHAVQSLKLYHHVKQWQGALSKLHTGAKPVIAAVHNLCIGGGVDLVSWCDIRLASADAAFSIKETQIGIVADLGTLQRIQRLTSYGFAREMAFTGLPVSAERCLRFGFLNEVYPNKEELLKGARSMAEAIAANSPLVVQGTKVQLNYALEHTTDDSLQAAALWNSAFLQSEDLAEAMASFFGKRKPIFRNKL